MGTRKTRGSAQLVRIAACAMALFCGAGCGAAAMVAVSLAGGAATASGEPQRLYGTQGQDFDEGRVAPIRSGVHVPADIVNIMGYPQSKIFTNTGGMVVPVLRPTNGAAIRPRKNPHGTISGWKGRRCAVHHERIVGHRPVRHAPPRRGANTLLIPRAADPIASRSARINPTLVRFLALASCPRPAAV